MTNRKLSLSTTHIIMLSFLVLILAGSLLLALPVSSAGAEAVPYLDALFTATTAACVTGLVTVPTVTTWSTFGQGVILILIQVGGLGVITIMSALMILLQLLQLCISLVQLLQMPLVILQRSQPLWHKTSPCP